MRTAPMPPRRLFGEEEISSVVVDSTVVGTNEFAVKVVKFMG